MSQSRHSRCMMDALEGRTLLAMVFNVISTADTPDNGTLRQAILQANALSIPNSATILFNIPGSGVHTIQPLTALPPITAQVDIQGTTDAAGDPLIEIDGEKVTGGGDVS